MSERRARVKLHDDYVTSRPFFCFFIDLMKNFVENKRQQNSISLQILNKVVIIR
jgi:hypothetical protein